MSTLWNWVFKPPRSSLTLEYSDIFFSVVNWKYPWPVRQTVKGEKKADKKKERHKIKRYKSKKKIDLSIIIDEF